MEGKVFFRRTDHCCTVAGISYPDIPVFFDQDGVVEPFSDYMIHLRYQGKVAVNSALTYAYQLQKFLNHLGSQSVDWREVADRDLIAWRDALIERDGLSRNTVAAYVGAAFAFYCWAEANGWVSGSVRLPTSGQADDGNALVPYRLSSKRSRDPKGRGWYVWAYTPKHEHRLNRHTPTPDEMDKLHEMAAQGRTAERDTLILSFYEELLLRRAEALDFKVADIPQWSEIDEFERDDKPFIVRVLGKGSKTRPVSMLPELAARARLYIEGERSRAVDMARARDPGYVEPRALFLADTTGLPLTKQYLSRRLSELMRATGISNASGHRVRAAGITAMVEAYDGVDGAGVPYVAEQVLWKVAERAGHAHIESLRPYLDLSRSRNAISDKEIEIRNASRERVRRRQQLLPPRGD